MDLEEVRATYIARCPQYQRASKNVREAVELLLAAASLPVLTVTSRVKDLDSFLEKCSRKSYANPFTENTDFIGIRIIAYLPRDVVEIINILQASFVVVESDDKAEGLAPDQFGYRSHHLIIKVPPQWTTAPNYEGLGNLPMEIQVRTILMHSWAEIEHKLQYKSRDQVPRELQRRLFLLSAKVEEADAQFEALVKEVEVYRQAIVEKTSKTGKFDLAAELNLDVFKEFVSFRYPTAPSSDKIAQELYDEVTSIGLSLKEMEEISEKFRGFERPLQTFVRKRLVAPAVLAYALEVFHPAYRAKINSSASRRRIVDEMRKLAEKKGLLADG